MMRHTIVVSLPLLVFSILALSIFSSLSVGPTTYNLDLAASSNDASGLGQAEVDNPSPTRNVRIEVIRSNGDKMIYEAHNLITNAGMNWTNQKTMNAATELGSKYTNYIALSTSATAVTYTNTTCATEVTTGSLGRAIATFSDGGAAANGDKMSYVYKNFTATAQVLNINKACLMTDSAGGVLFAAVLLPSTINMESGDKINAQWNVTRTK